MDNHKVVVAILVLAILFSVVATVMSLSILDFKPIFVQRQQVVNSAEGSHTGGVNILIDPFTPSSDQVLG